MKLIGNGRIGRDVEVRRTQSGEPVANISIAWNYGTKDQNGKRPTQWLDAALFGKRAESLAPYLKKGTTVFCDLRDVHIQTYKNKDGDQNFKLTGVVDSIEFVGSRDSQEEPKRKTIAEEDNDLPF